MSVVWRFYVNIYVLRLILKFNMFFMKVRCIWKTFKTFPNFLRHGFWCPWKRLLCLYDCFLGIKNMSTARNGGIRALKNFNLGTWLLWRLKNTFATLYILTTPTAPHTKLFQKTKLYLKHQLRPKVTIKGMKKLKLKV